MNYRHFQDSNRPPEDLGVESISVTSILKLREVKHTDQIFEKVREDSKYSWESKIRSVESRITAAGEGFDVKIGCKQIAPPGTEDGSKRSQGSCTDRIRIKVETRLEDPLEEFHSILKSAVKLSDQIFSMLAELGGQPGTISITVRYEDSLVNGREVFHQPAGEKLELFNQNVRLRDINHEDRYVGVNRITELL